MYAIIAKDDFYVRTLGYVRTIEEWLAIREKLDAELIAQARPDGNDEWVSPISVSHAREIEYWAEEVEAVLTPDEALQSLLFQGVAP